jgi:hypothetical protein
LDDAIGRVDLIQIRERDLDGRRLLGLAELKAEPVAQATQPPAPPRLPARDERLKEMADKAVAAPKQELVAASELQQAVAANEMDVADRKVAKKEKAATPVAVSMVLVREFAHQVRPNRNPTDRIDFAETLCWSAGVRIISEATFRSGSTTA